MTTSAIAFDGFPLIGATPGGGRASVTTFEGWLSASHDRIRSKRTGKLGAFSTKHRRMEKRITAVGQIVYPTAAAAAAERRTILALGGNDTTLLQVTDSFGDLQQFVELDSVVAMPVRDSMLHFTFDMLAADPLARAVTATTVAVGAGATVSHTAAGTFPAEIEVALTSAGTVDLTIAGLRLRWGSLPSGAVLTSGPGFTRPKRTVQSSTGANLYGLIVQPSQWPAMSPGVNSIHQAGTAGLSIRYFPTYA